jgi:sterol desaturase/sphingolipid hydroxylase (fatty acid hydroxylase superfamily)
MYLWHILMHRIRLFWRFHLAHHTDLDLDASTALRFHFGELLVSVPWRAGQILLIGVSPLSFSVWQFLFLLAIMFHHSGVALPVEVERRLAWVIVTPRMHGIHHSMVRQESDSNWSSIFSIWDRLHGSLRLNVPQRQVTIGVPAFREPRQVTLMRTLTVPFETLPPIWSLPGNGEPARSLIANSCDHLLA